MATQKLTISLKAQINAIIPRYVEPRSAVMPALHLIQDEFGYISREAMEEVATILGLTPVQVYEIASFYHQFHTKPIGCHHLQVCINVSCMLLGAENIVSQLEQSLNIESGQTTADGRFTLSAVQCLGSCDTAPVMQINNQAYCEHLTGQRVEEILQRLREAPMGHRPEAFAGAQKDQREFTVAT